MCIDIETGIPELLNNSYPSSVMNDEVLPKPVFFADYSKVAFTMKKEAADQEDFYNRSDADLVLLDFSLKCLWPELIRLQDTMIKSGQTLDRQMHIRSTKIWQL